MIFVHQLLKTLLSHFLLSICNSALNFINGLRARFSYERFRFGISFLVTHVRRKRHLWEKFVRKMLMKLTPGVNYINVLRAAFACTDPKRAKRHWWLDCHYAVILGSAFVKAAHKHVGEIDQQGSMKYLYIKIKNLGWCKNNYF